MLIGISGFAQDKVKYTLGTTSGNVECYYNLTTCDGKTVVLLRFNNRNTTPVTISWKEVFTTKQFPEKAVGYWPKQVTIAPGISEAAGCGDTNHKGYILSFEYNDVSITPAQ